MNLNLVIAIAYFIAGVALLIGGIIVPLVYTVLPIARSNDHCPNNLVWRLVLKSLFLIILIKDGFVHGYVALRQNMPPDITYTTLDFVVIVGLIFSLIATWLTHPDGVKSV